MECKVHRKDNLSQNDGGRKRKKRGGEDGQNERGKAGREGLMEREGTGRIDSIWRGAKGDYSWYILQAL